jgi:hypothetical protein
MNSILKTINYNEQSAIDNLVSVNSDVVYSGVTLIGSYGGNNLYKYCILCKNNKIFIPPFNAINALVLDLSNDSVITLPNISGLTNIAQPNLSKPILANNGNIYCAASYANFCIEYNPTTNNITTFGQGQFSNIQPKYYGAGYAYKNYVYFLPAYETTILEVNTDNLNINFYDTFEIVTGNNARHYAASTSYNNFIYTHI